MEFHSAFPSLPESPGEIKKWHPRLHGLQGKPHIVVDDRVIFSLAQDATQQPIRGPHLPHINLQSGWHRRPTKIKQKSPSNNQTNNDANPAFVEVRVPT